jgi:hypothetical protein
VEDVEFFAPYWFRVPFPQLGGVRSALVDGVEQGFAHLQVALVIAADLGDDV